MPDYMPEGYLRMLDNELTCPTGLYGEGHDDGMVWSGYVWKLRDMLGAEVMDPLYLDVIAHFPANIDFPSATQVLLERAASVLDGETLQTMRDLAEARGGLNEQVSFETWVQCYDPNAVPQGTGSEDDEKCGCATRTPSTLGLLFLPALVLGLRRRR